jgi:putative ABC transport system ATP-binding protein
LSFPDLQLHAGEKILIVGPSGSGKSTFLNLLSGVLPNQHGTITLNGCDYTTQTRQQLDQLRADHIGIIFQSLNLIPYLTGFENAALSLQFSKERRAQVTDINTSIDQLADGLGLTSDILAKQPKAMSIGQQQRIAVIRAMLGKPALILADEPTSALDPVATEQFMTELTRSIDPTKQAVIVVSHNPALIPLFDRVVQIGGDA